MLCRFLFSVILVLGISTTASYADSKDPSTKAIARDQYELKLVRVELEPGARIHDGLFRFVWKGSSPIRVLASAFDAKKELMPFASFSVHTQSGWAEFGTWCSRCAQKTVIQPGQSMICRIPLGRLKGATRFRMRIARW